MSKKELTQRETIVAVLEIALEQASDNKFRGVRYIQAQYKNIKDYESSLRRLVKSKIILFNNLDDKSATYGVILSNAKRALVDVQAGLFDFHSAELINKFLSLEEIFYKNLEFKGIRKVEELELEPVKEKVKQLVEHKDMVIRKEEKVTYLEEGVTGKKLTARKRLSKAFDIDGLDIDGLDLEGGGDKYQEASNIDL